MSTISLRDWQAPHISPTATLKLPTSLCSHNPLWRWGSHFHCKGPDWRRGCRITRAIYRVTKKCWGPGYVSTGSNKEVFHLFEIIDAAFVAVVLALSVFLMLSMVYMGPDEINNSAQSSCRGPFLTVFDSVCSVFLFEHKPARFLNPLNLILRCSCPIHLHRQWICQPAVS